MKISEKHATLITKSIATDLLNMNTKNRRVKNGNIKLIKHELENGLFKFNGESIIVGKSGILLDGQHRLLAVEETGIPMKSIIVYDVDDSVFSTIDTGMSRTNADVLSIKGIPNYSTVAKVSKMLIMFARGENNLNGRDKSYKISNEEVLRFAIEHNDVLQQIMTKSISLYNKSRLLTVSEIAFYYLVLESDNKKLCDLFFDSLFKGISSSEFNPAIILRNKLTEFKINKNISINPAIKAKIIFKCWNKFKDNKEIKFIRISDKEIVIRPKIFYKEN